MTSIINNYKKLSSTYLRKSALDILISGVERVLPEILMSNVKYDQDTKTLTVNDVHHTINGRIFIIGGGKAVGAMAEQLEQIIGIENITDGIINSISTEHRTKKVHCIKAGHPLPDNRSIEGTKMIMDLKNKYTIDDSDTVICLLSGGGSSMLSLPAEGILLNEERAINDLLLRCGATIQEINTVRKHLSQIKGGKLGKYLQPATVISIILSDVLDDNISTIASGPTSPDSTTYADARAILTKYGILKDIPDHVLKYIGRGMLGHAPETTQDLSNCHNHIIGNNATALHAMNAKATQLGYRPTVLTAVSGGEPSLIAQQKLQEIIELRKKGFNAFLLGTETSPRVPKEHGTGGRNQHYAAINLLEMQPIQGHWAMASMNSDGQDNTKDIAGAIIDTDSIHIAKQFKPNIEHYLKKCDSFTLLDKIGDSLIESKPTHTNVCDLVVYLFE